MLVPNPSYPIHIYGPVIAGAHVVSVPVHNQDDFLAELEAADPAHDPAPQGAHRQLPVEPDHGVRRAALPRPPRRDWPASTASISSTTWPTPTSPSTATSRPACSRSPAPKMSPSSSSPSRRATTCPAGASASWSATPVLVCRARPPQELLRLRHLHAHPGRVHRRARRPAGVRRRDLRDLPPPPQRARRRPQQSRLARAQRPRPPCSSGRKSPKPFRELKSLEFSKLLLTEAKVAVSPGIGFGDYGDNHVRFALIENEERTRQALRGIKQMLAKGVVHA